MKVNLTDELDARRATPTKPAVSEGDIWEAIPQQSLANLHLPMGTTPLRAVVHRNECLVRRGAPATTEWLKVYVQVDTSVAIRRGVVVHKPGRASTSRIDGGTQPAGAGLRER